LLSLNSFIGVGDFEGIFDLREVAEIMTISFGDDGNLLGFN